MLTKSWRGAARILAVGATVLTVGMPLSAKADILVPAPAAITVFNGMSVGIMGPEDAKVVCKKVEAFERGKIWTGAFWTGAWTISTCTIMLPGYVVIRDVDAGVEGSGGFIPKAVCPSVAAKFHGTWNGTSYVKSTKGPETTLSSIGMAATPEILTDYCGVSITDNPTYPPVKL